MNVVVSEMKVLIKPKVAILFVMLLVSTSLVTAQRDLEKLRAEYAENITKTRIDGVYIPKDLPDAFKELELLSSEESIKKFKNAPEEVIAHKLHFGLGRWIDYNWNFEKGSRFEHYLRGLGLKERDHMMQFTIVSWHRHLNDQPLEIVKQVEKYDEMIEKQDKRRLAHEVETVEETIIVVPKGKD